MTHQWLLLIQVGDGLEVFNKLQKRGIITRPMSKELGQYLRISVGTEHENEKVIFALNEIFKGKINKTTSTKYRTVQG